MPTFVKRQVEAVKWAAQISIGRALKNRYGTLTQEPLPTSFTALLARLESAERIARLKARVERLRRGLTK
jgi:hypothetical protein